MSRSDWLKHRTEVYESLGLDPDPTKATDETKRAFLAHRGVDRKACKLCNARGRTARANKNARERNEVYRSLGMTKTSYGWE
jgi:hypothetical protein